MPASSLLQLLGVQPKPASLSSSAIIVVDAQREYLDGSVPLKGIDAALVEIKQLLSKARALKVPIFHVVHHTQAGAPVFNPESPMSHIIDEVKPFDDERVIVKHLPSSFVNTELKRFIDETGKKELVVVGFMTHMCVNATTRSAVDLGFAPTVIADACATRDLPAPDGTVLAADLVHKSNLASIADLLACVCQSVDELN
jgi:nicotinamidase-related amidase